MAGWEEEGGGGGSNSTETTGALDTPSPHTLTHTYILRLGTQISEQFSGRMIGSLMRILPLQARLITPAIPFRHAISPSLSPLFLPLSPPFFVTVTLSTPPCPDPLLLLPSTPSLALPLSLSLGLLWDYYNDRGDKGHLSHVRRGE